MAIDGPLDVTDLDPNHFSCDEEQDPHKIVLDPSKRLAPEPVEVVDISTYENTSGMFELAWMGGTAEAPECVYLVFPDGDYVKLEAPLQDSEAARALVLSYLTEDLDIGVGTDDVYAIPEMSGPVWQVDSVVYGAPALGADLTGCAGTDLDTLISALNDCPNNPGGFVWGKDGVTLTLTAPSTMKVQTVALAGGQVVDFSGTPTTPGVDPSPVFNQILGMLGAWFAATKNNPEGPLFPHLAEALETYFNANEIGFADSLIRDGTATDEAAIETEFSASSKGWVQWTRASDGRKILSQKRADGTWHHPGLQFYALDSSVQLLSLGSGTRAYDASGDVPSGVQFIQVFVSVNNAKAFTSGTVSTSATDDTGQSHSGQGIAQVAGDLEVQDNTAISGAGEATLDLIGYWA